MNAAQKIIDDKGRTFVQMPLEDWKTIEKDLEALEALKIQGRIEAGEEETFPAELVNRLCEGENPIKVYREHRGMTQASLAKAAGVHQPAVARAERGEARPSAELIKKLASALALDMEDLV